MAVRLIITHGSTTEPAGQAAIAAIGEQIVLTASADFSTPIVAWQILCWDSPDSYGTLFRPTIASGVVTPSVVASGSDGVPTATFTRTVAGPLLLELKTWPSAVITGTPTSDYREIRVALPNLGDCAPSVVRGDTLRAAIAAQEAAGRGAHNNVSGETRGWGSVFLPLIAGTLSPALAQVSTALANAGTGIANAAAALAAAQAAQSTADNAHTDAGTALSNAATAQGTANTAVVDAATALSAAQAAQADVDALSSGGTLAFSATISATQSGVATYYGSDASVVMIPGTPPFRAGSMVTVVFPAGSITGANTVTVDAAIAQPRDMVALDPTADYVLRFWAESTRILACSATIEERPDVDTSAPLITAVAVAESNMSAIAVTTNEAVAWADATGFSCVGHTLGAVTGSGTSWSIAVTPAFVVGESTTLVWDATNGVEDASENALEAGSRAVSNGLAYPTIATAAISPSGLSLVLGFSETCLCTSLQTGALVLSGAGGVTVDSYISGSGTNSLTFALSGPVVGGTVTLDVATSNGVTDSAGLALQSTTGVAVNSSAEYPTITSITIDGANITVNASEALSRTSNTNWSLSVGGVSATLTYVSGSGTATLLYTSSIAAENGDTVTATATAPTGHASSATGLAPQAFSGVSVTNNTAGAAILSDTFTTERDQAVLVTAGWNLQESVVASATGGYFTRTDSGAPRFAVHALSDTARVDYTMTAVVPHAQVSKGTWGFVLAFASGDGVVVWVPWGGVTHFAHCTVAGLADTPVVGSDTPWTGSDDHTVVITKSGSTYTLTTDGTLQASFTDATNAAATGASVGFFGEAGSTHQFSSIEVI
jgi:hypothetical protein